jgi:serine/threonine-protein kinase
MGRVVEAWDPVLKRSVALKLLYGRDPEHLVRALREAQSQARLDHPNVCRVLEVEAEAEQPFIAMALIQGKPLGDLRLQLDDMAIARIMADVAGAIHAAHKAGIVHRDLKPQNILVEALPESGWMPFVVDFGLARDLAREDQTLSWAMVGTPAFMSPQQAQGEPARPADDIYSLGATLYALLGGVPPHEATTLAGLISQQVREDPRPLRRHLPRVPKDLETIVMTCLESDPARRYASAFDLESDLRRYLAGEPVLARPSTPLYRLWRRAVRQKALSLTLLGSALLVALLVTWNVRTRIQGARQAELATRFGLEAKGLESLMRLERLMPPHDLRPAEARLREGMAGIQRDMNTLGRAAQGPGHYALGRVALVLREDEAAQKHLEQAWDLGFRTPEAAYALGLAVARSYEREWLAVCQQEQALPARLTAHEALMAKYGNRALACFAQSHGQALDHPAYGEAQMASIRGDRRTCIQKCQEAYAALPWLVEAKLLEAQNWGHLAYDQEDMNQLDLQNHHHARRRAALEEAMARAPSDDSVLIDAIGDVAHQANRESLEGHPSEGAFKAGEALYQRALLIRPGDPELVDRFAKLRMRHAILLGSHGRDTRALLQETSRLAASAPFQPAAGLPTSTLLHLFYGAAQWMWGEDPRPALDRARATLPSRSVDRAEASLVEARFLLARRQDPGPILRAALSELGESAHPNSGTSFYQQQTLGEIHSLLAQWEHGQGRDPSRAIQEGLRAIRHSLEHHEANAYARWDEALLEAMDAERRALQGEPYLAELGRAKKAAALAMNLRGDHYRSVWTHCQVHLAEARILRSAGKDPGPSLGQVRKALTRAFTEGHTSFLLHEAQARLELMAGNTKAAEVAARRGLAVKPDAKDLQLVLAEARRLARTGAPL